MVFLIQFRKRNMWMVGDVHHRGVVTLGGGWGKLLGGDTKEGGSRRILRGLVMEGRGVKDMEREKGMTKRGVKVRGCEG
jgi:hypothetical protein